MPPRLPVFVLISLAACGGKASYLPPSAPDADAAAPDAAAHDAAPDAAEPQCTIDEDGDGSMSAACGGRDCDDGNPGIRPSADDPGEWTFEVVDEAGWALGPAIAADATGAVHMVYEDRTAGTLNHATNAGGEWSVEAVEEGGRGAVLVIVRAGVLEVVHERDDGLRHAQLGEGGWATGNVVQPEPGHRLTQPSLAQDGDGRLRLAYLDVVAGESSIQLATRNGEVWGVASLGREGLADPPDDGAPSVAVDPDGNVQVVFTSGGQLRRAVLVDDAPTAETIDVATDAEAPRLAFDPAGTAVIAYRDPTERALGIARSDGGTWASEAVDTRNDPGQSSSLAVDQQGGVHVLYHAAGNFDVRYATDAFGAWIFQTLDRSGEAGATIAIDGDGVLLMGFVTTDSDLHFARHVGGDGIDQDCSGEIDG